MAKCRECMHNRVCGFKQDYVRYEQLLPNVDKPFTASVVCGEFASDVRFRGMKMGTTALAGSVREEDNGWEVK